MLGKLDIFMIKNNAKILCNKITSEACFSHKVLFLD